VEKVGPGRYELGPDTGLQMTLKETKRTRDVTQRSSPSRIWGPEAAVHAIKFVPPKRAMHRGSSRDGPMSPLHHWAHIADDSLYVPAGPSLCVLLLQQVQNVSAEQGFCECGRGCSDRQAPCNDDVKSLPCRGLTCPTFFSVGFLFFIYFNSLILSPQERGCAMIT